MMFGEKEFSAVTTVFILQVCIDNKIDKLYYKKSLSVEYTNFKNSKQYKKAQ